MKNKIENIFLGKQIMLLEPHILAGDKATVIKIVRNGMIVNHIKTGSELFIDEKEQVFLISSSNVIKTNCSLN